MRTTIELPEEQRAELLRLAARQGQKGFSGLIQEAVRMYLERTRTTSESASRALALQGTFRGKAANQFEEAALAARGHWR